MIPHSGSDCVDILQKAEFQRHVRFIDNQDRSGIDPQYFLI